MFVYAGADRIGGDGVDVVVLAQASMARVVEAMPKGTLPGARAQQPGARG